MTNADLVQAEASEPTQAKVAEPTTVRSLNISLKLDEGEDVGEIVARARELGQITNLSFQEYQSFGNQYDLPY